MAQARCVSCNGQLVKPYIKCAQCSAPPVELCLCCFSGGFEQNCHKSDHTYEVIKDDFILFNHSWSAGEEMCLLNAVAECGFGNWSEVSDQVQYRTASECENHYKQCYLDVPQPPLPDMPIAEMNHFPCPIPFKVSQAPPRPLEDSSLQIEMSGYSAARSDFAVEHNNFAELDIRDVALTANDGTLGAEKKKGSGILSKIAGHIDIDVSLCKCSAFCDMKLSALQLAMLRIYRNILKERQRRKLRDAFLNLSWGKTVHKTITCCPYIVRQFGLIDVAAHMAYIRHYEHVLSLKTVDTLRRLSSLFVKQPLLWDFVIEALSMETGLRQRITELQRYRQAGLRWLRSAKLYDKMAARQEVSRPHLLDDVLHYIQDSYQCQPWVQRKMVFDKLSKSIAISHPAPPRRSAPPLDIVGLPGYERLTDSEKQLCSRVRLVPESYLEFKNVLVNECRKQGQLRLAQARMLIKIDVNKTRKIYDFLVSEHFITSNKNTSSGCDPAQTSC